ncbi:MAG: RHS repeat domain-containing protein, partial [Patescibacteria group bacterium]|nr:RHS repeat domain-containing protein [Patescibacteria group bacterium]
MGSERHVRCPQSGGQHGRLQEQAEGKNRQTAYDPQGNVVGTTDAKGQSASSAFDARDRRVSETDRLAGVTSWRFDENSNLRHLTDAENQSP